MTTRGRRRRGGWRRKGGKIQAYVRLYHGKGGMPTRTYPLGTAPKEMQDWIDDTVLEYRRKHPKGAPGTLARDVATYLPVLVDRPRLQRERARQLAWWAERFGARARWSLQPIELETALNGLTASGAAASTVKKYRTALYHLFTKLGGKNGSNPLRDVTPPREPEPLPRWIPASIVRQIFDAIPDQRFARRLSPADRASIRRQLRAQDANVSAIARVHRVSEAAVRKIRDGRGNARDAVSLSKVRLQMMYATGWAPAMIRAFRLEDYDPLGPSILARGRSKGKGVRSERLPLTPEGVAAVEAFIAADAFERDTPAGRTAFSMTSPLRAWRRAIARVCARLEADPTTRDVGRRLRAQLATSTPYALRHSFLTEIQLASGNPSATQTFALHADPRMTRRYTLAAVAPELKEAAAMLATRQAEAGNPQATKREPQSDGSVKKRGKRTPSRPAGKGRKMRRIA